jgi:hypothetical protein
VELVVTAKPSAKDQADGSACASIPEQGEENFTPSPETVLDRSRKAYAPHKCVQAAILWLCVLADSESNRLLSNERKSLLGPIGLNLCSNFAFSIRAEEALRRVLRALSIFQHLNHLPAASPSPQLDRNVTIVGANSGPVCIFIGACASVRWLA